MGEIVPIDLGVQSAPGRYGPDGGARLINCFAEKADEKSRLLYPVYPFEGFEQFSVLTGGGRTRGMISLGTYGYIVSGANVYKVDSGGQMTVIGDFPGTGQVFMAKNSKTTPQVALASEGQRYIIESDVLTSIADVHLPSATSVTELNKYFVWGIPDGRYFWSSVDEGTAYDALDFATAEARGDELRVVFSRGTELILFGTESIEFHAVSTGDAPFAAIPGATLYGLGVMCRHSVRSLNDVPMFVASDGTVRMMAGYSPERISTHDVERAIDSVVDKDSIIATAYPSLGNQFYQLSCEDWTWTYNALTQTWVERMSYGLNRWKADHFMKVGESRLVGGYNSGIVYRMDPDLYDEAGEHLIMTLRPPPTHKTPNPITVDRLFVDTIPGAGLNSSDAALSDPKVMLRTSIDSGRSWSTEMTASVGEQGAYRTKVAFDGLGQSDEDGMIFEVSMSAAVARGITSMSAEIEIDEA
jgi:hypothetical protein